MHNSLKDGATHYNEVIFRAREIGWSKEHIGSHVVRNNEIFHCEQAGIVGSLGAVFSQITDNHIHDIWIKRIYAGAEMAGIKIHASIDMLIRNNHIHNTGRGIWLDWMAQGARVTGNLLYDNTTDDLFMEVNHGPFLIDNNIFLSPTALRDWSEGGAYIHNLITGGIQHRQVLNRFTPYHFSHSTHVAGLRNILAGDNRFFNNIFTGTSGGLDDADNSQDDIDFYGLTVYDRNTEYSNIASGNVYYSKARPGKNETEYVQNEEFKPEIAIETKGDGIYLTIRVNRTVLKAHTKLVTSRLLGNTIVSEANFENPDGTPYVLDEDYLGKKRDPEHVRPGPFSQLEAGDNWLQIR
jgi:hypothetical protein